MFKLANIRAKSRETETEKKYLFGILSENLNEGDAFKLKLQHRWEDNINIDAYI